MTAVLRRERNQSIDERHTCTLHCRDKSVVAARLALEEACFQQSRCEFDDENPPMTFVCTCQETCS